MTYFMKYKAIGFDYGGVIMDNLGSDFNSAICKILDIDLETYEKIYFKNNYLITTKGMDRKDFWKKLLVEFKRIEKEEEIFNFLRTQPKKELNQEMIELIKTLRNNGYKIGMLSNNSTKVNEKIKKDGIDKFFDVILISEDIGYMKPDPKAFELFLEKLDVKSEELVFIDDTDINLSTVESIGFTPILFKNIEDLKRDFIRLGVL